MSHFTKKQALLIIGGIIFLILLCFTAYGEILEYYFTSIDSFPLLLVGKIDTLRDIPKIFTSPLGGGFPFGSYYRPVSELSFGIDYIIWGNNPTGYHLSDLFLHLGNSFLVFLMAGLLFKSYNNGLLYAWIASVLFLLSPINMSVVTTMERRQDMVMALFLSLSLVTFSKVERTKSNKAGWYLLSLFLGFLAIFSKESAFVLPVLVCLLSFVFSEKDGYWKRIITALKYSIPFFCFVLLNTLLHLYFFGHWEVHVSSGVSQRIIAATKSFFTLVGPLELLGLKMVSKSIVLLCFLFVFFLIVLRMLVKLGVEGTLELILKKEWRIYTYLITFILTFVALFTARGTSHDFYHYLPNMALTILISLLLLDSFRNKITSIMMKSIGAVFVIYIVVYSPIFTDYKAWWHSSDITRQVISQTENFLISDEDASRIYLVNWPGFIGPDSEAPGTNSTILVSYSMNAWAEWSGLKSLKDVEFIHISYASFPSDDLHAKLNYSFSDKKIHMDVKGCWISPSKVPYKGDVPFKFTVNENKTEGKIIFTRQLHDDERLFLYDTEGFEIMDNKFNFRPKEKINYENGFLQ